MTQGIGRKQAVLVLFLLLTLFLALAHVKKEEEGQAQARKALDEEMEALTQAGFYDEAVKSFEQKKNARTPQSSQYYFDSLIQTNQLARAYSFCQEEDLVQEDLQGIQTLVDHALRTSNPSLAWEIYLDQGKNLDPGQAGLLRWQVFSFFEKFEREEDLVFAWVHDKACLKGEKGVFLVGPNGKRLDQSIYQAIKPVKEGFLAKTGDSYFFLDQAGHFSAVVGPGDFQSQPSLQAKVEEDGQVPQAMDQDGSWAYFLDGRPLFDPSYDRLTPLSSKGVGFGLRRGVWEEISFPVLNP